MDMDIIDQIDLMLNELKWKRVFRKGKLRKKAVCPEGFRFDGKKCVKMAASERRKRSISTMRAQRKFQASGKAAKAIRKRAKSMRKRDALIPTQTPPEVKV